MEREPSLSVLTQQRDAYRQRDPLLDLWMGLESYGIAVDALVSEAEAGTPRATVVEGELLDAVMGLIAFRRSLTALREQVQNVAPPESTQPTAAPLHRDLLR